MVAPVAKDWWFGMSGKERGGGAAGRVRTPLVALVVECRWFGRGREADVHRGRRAPNPNGNWN